MGHEATSGAWFWGLIAVWWGPTVLGLDCSVVGAYGCQQTGGRRRADPHPPDKRTRRISSVTHRSNYGRNARDEALE